MITSTVVEDQCPIAIDTDKTSRDGPSRILDDHPFTAHRQVRLDIRPARFKPAVSQIAVASFDRIEDNAQKFTPVSLLACLDENAGSSRREIVTGNVGIDSEADDRNQGRRLRIDTSLPVLPNL